MQTGTEMPGTGMTGTGRVRRCDAPCRIVGVAPTSIFDETTNATLTRRRRRSRSTETRTLWCHLIVHRSSLSPSRASFRAAFEQSLPIPDERSRPSGRPPGGASRLPRRLFFVDRHRLVRSESPWSRGRLVHDDHAYRARSSATAARSGSAARGGRAGGPAARPSLRVIDVDACDRWRRAAPGRVWARV